MPKKPPAQFELFAGAADPRQVHALGLLGWKDPIWTTKFAIKLLDGTDLKVDLLTIRLLHQIARKPDPPLPTPTS